MNCKNAIANLTDFLKLYFILFFTFKVKVE